MMFGNGADVSCFVGVILCTPSLYQYVCALLFCLLETFVVICGSVELCGSVS